MGLLSKRPSAAPSEAATAGESVRGSVKVRCERDDMVISYDLGCEGADKRPSGSFSIPAGAKISYAGEPLEWLLGKYVSFSVYSGEQFVKRREDKWGIGTLSVNERRQDCSDINLDLYLDVSCARDLAYMLNDWRRTQGTIPGLRQ